MPFRSTYLVGIGGHWRLLLSGPPRNDISEASRIYYLLFQCYRPGSIKHLCGLDGIRWYDAPCMGGAAWLIEEDLRLQCSIALLS